MRAVQFSTFGGPEVLRIDSVPTPQPGPGQTLVRVTATSVQPADVIARAGHFGPALPPREVYRTGWDFVGVVDSDGSRFARGSRVIGVTAWLRDLNGTHAHAVVVDDDHLAIAPEGLVDSRAAALPVTALTAVQALDLLPADTHTLAVVGAGGVVGGYTLELARDRGLRTFGVASASYAERVEARGAHLVDRDRDPVAQLVSASGGGVDAVVDTASVAESIGAVRVGGTYVGVIHPFLPPPERSVRVTAVAVRPDQAQLEQVSRLAGAGRLTPTVALELALSDAVEAHRAVERPGRGGTVVMFPDDNEG